MLYKIVLLLKPVPFNMAVHDKLTRIKMELTANGAHFQAQIADIPVIFTPWFFYELYKFKNLKSNCIFYP